MKTYTVLTRTSAPALAVLINASLALNSALAGGISTHSGHSSHVPTTLYSQAVLLSPEAVAFLDYWLSLDRNCLRSRRNDADAPAVFVVGEKDKLYAWEVAFGRAREKRSGDDDDDDDDEPAPFVPATVEKLVGAALREILESLDNGSPEERQAVLDRYFYDYGVMVLYGTQKIFYQDPNTLASRFGTIADYALADYGRIMRKAAGKAEK